MKRISFVLVFLACAISLSNTTVSFSDELTPIQFPNTQADGGKPVRQALEDRSPIRSFSSSLEVTKACKPHEPVAVGQQATCAIIILKLGPDPAFNVAIIDKLISVGTFTIGAVTTSEGSCTATTFTPLDQSGTVTCIASSITPNTTITIKVPVSTNTPQDINDVVTVSGQPFDPIPGNNSASCVVHVIVYSN